MKIRAEQDELEKRARLAGEDCSAPTRGLKTLIRKELNAVAEKLRRRPALADRRPG
jgi:hypothetical protein